MTLSNIFKKMMTFPYNYNIFQQNADIPITLYIFDEMMTFYIKL